MEIVSLGTRQALCNPGWPPTDCIAKDNPEPIFLPLLLGGGNTSAKATLYLIFRGL
ncbi:hypothetical protein I79_023669 [Cricetulus griseus]|uniref:Uncharacterized protein n=1 Tax=Cricetulus griseus TaxID=10029 RepID=G3IIJ7_CRIGR|nr:hypothetical protein I79_023669 [Cricetulus griseus]